MFVADALGGWLVGQLADAGREKLTELVLGSEQERALRRAADAAVWATAENMSPSGGEQAGQLTMVINQVFGDPVPGAPLAGPVMLLEGRQGRHVLHGQPCNDDAVPLRHAQQYLAGRCVQLIAVAAHDGDDRDRIDREPAEGKRQGLHRPAVRSLHVVDHQRHRPGAQLIAYQARQLGPHRERRYPHHIAREQRVPGQRPPPGAGHELPDDPVLQVGLGRVGPGPPRGQPGRGGQPTPGQRRLADPRLALDADLPGLAVPHPGEHVRQLSQLRRPPDKDVLLRPSREQQGHDPV
jgi:hypothetical protein